MRKCKNVKNKSMEQIVQLNAVRPKDNRNKVNFINA